MSFDLGNNLVVFYYDLEKIQRDNDREKIFIRNSANKTIKRGEISQKKNVTQSQRKRVWVRKFRAFHFYQIPLNTHENSSTLDDKIIMEWGVYDIAGYKLLSSNIHQEKAATSYILLTCMS